MVDLTVDNLTIPAGNYVSIAPTIISQDSNLFPNPSQVNNFLYKIFLKISQYDPFRWSDREKVKTDSSNYSLLHFGYGKHRCLGEKFATHTVKLGLFKILKQYQVQLINNELPTPNYSKSSGTPFAKEKVPVKINKL